MIVVEDLWKSYGSFQVLRGLNLQVEKGETLVILGRSGVGKSVLLKQVIGIEAPDQGLVRVDGKNLHALSKKARYEGIKHMGMLFQGAALFDSMNIFDNVAFHLRAHGNVGAEGECFAPGEIKDRVEEALSRVGLEGVQEKMPSDLSGGMKKRAALARIMVYRPKILLYDEPTTGLDPVTSVQINQLIVNIQQDLEATSIVVTHDIRSALEVGDRIALHDEGQIRYVAKKDEFFKIDHPLIQQFAENIPSGGQAKQ